MSERASQAGATAALALTPIRTRLGGARAGFETSVWTLVESDVPALLAEVERLRAALSGRAASEPVAWMVEKYVEGLGGWLRHNAYTSESGARMGAAKLKGLATRVVPLGIIGGDSEP